MYETQSGEIWNVVKLGIWDIFGLIWIQCSKTKVSEEWVENRKEENQMVQLEVNLRLTTIENQGLGRATINRWGIPPSLEDGASGIILFCLTAFLRSSFSSLPTIPAISAISVICNQWSTISTLSTIFDFSVISTMCNLWALITTKSWSTFYSLWYAVTMTSSSSSPVNHEVPTPNSSPMNPNFTAVPHFPLISSILIHNISCMIPTKIKRDNYLI